jgi:hypothetical protein
LNTLAIFGNCSAEHLLNSKGNAVLIHFAGLENRRPAWADPQQFVQLSGEPL